MRIAMNTKLLAASAIALGMIGCASTPMLNPQLESARTLLRTTEADPNVAKYAALDMEAARKELAIADAASLRNDQPTVSQAAYLASQTARLAQFRASAKADDARVAAGQAEREQIELAATNRQIQKANTEADQAAAKSAALKAELEALKAQRAQQ
jgi:hypothetical protein